MPRPTGWRTSEKACEEGVIVLKVRNFRPAFPALRNLSCAGNASHKVVSFGDRILTLVPSRAYSAEGRTPGHRPREAQGARGGQWLSGEQSAAAGARKPGV